MWFFYITFLFLLLSVLQNYYHILYFNKIGFWNQLTVEYNAEQFLEYLYNQFWSHNNKNDHMGEYRDINKPQSRQYKLIDDINILGFNWLFTLNSIILVYWFCHIIFDFPLVTLCISTTKSSLKLLDWFYKQITQHISII